MLRQHWFLKEDPQVPAAPALFERCLNAHASELELELEQILKRLPIVRIDSHPFHALCSRVDRVDPERNPALQVTLDVAGCQFKGIAPLPRAIVVVAA